MSFRTLPNLAIATSDSLTLIARVTYLPPRLLNLVTASAALAKLFIRVEVVFNCVLTTLRFLERLAVLPRIVFRCVSNLLRSVVSILKPTEANKLAIFLFM